MKTILKRISSRYETMQLEIYFKGENNEIRKEIISLKRTDAGSLRIENNNHLLLQTEGEIAEKLQIK